MQSCNLEPGSASRVSTGKNPVEYYVAKNTTAGAATYGQYWFSSTDCANYDNTTTATHTFTLDRSIHLTAYFTPNTDIVTLIEGVEVKVPANNVFYDLQGRQVLMPQKGIYILNGKKVIVK